MAKAESGAPPAQAEDDATSSEAKQRAGWPLAPWCRATGISRALLYRLPPEQQPFSVKVRKRRIIYESPIAWLRRMAVRQKAAA